ncbi:SEFIR domain-containing protein [Actinokineospora sp. NBRC 105648]|uniref:SEFIR domain-containing protein n=1 Tax=Actinokineospora sp. NBRC 105648 TaxID=3032206 RepID=UPI0025560108|nr:SEFIR domain-containing protein [Actinokineospora sp. NBRC 105648]
MSYAHDTPEHKRTVRALAEFLVQRGMDVDLDQWADVARIDWGSWAVEGMSKADFVLVVASPDYQRVGDGVGPTLANRGVQAETAVLRDLLHGDRQTWLSKLLPVLLPGHDVEEIPLFLQPRDATHYRVTSIDDRGAEDLLRVLTGQPARVRPDLGTRPVLPPEPPAAYVAPVVSPDLVQWRPLKSPLEVVSRAVLLRQRHRAVAPTVEVHLVPVGGYERLQMRRLNRFGDELAVLGRQEGLFSAVQGLTVGSTEQASWAATDDVRGGPVTGLAVFRDGQRSCWTGFPKATVGTVLVYDDLVRRIADALALLTSIALPEPAAVALSVAIEPISGLREGTMADLASNSGSMSYTQLPEIRLPAEDSVAYADVVRHGGEIADELAARLVMALRGTRPF